MLLPLNLEEKDFTTGRKELTSDNKESNKQVKVKKVKKKKENSYRLVSEVSEYFVIMLVVHLSKSNIFNSLKLIECFFLLHVMH